MRLLKEIRSLIGNYNLKSGVYHYYRHEYPQAVDYLRKALKHKSTSAEDRKRAASYLTLSFMDSARKRETEGDIAGAIESLSKAAEARPEFPDIHFRLGRLLETTGSIDRAIDEYNLAIRHHAGYGEAQTRLAFCLLQQPGQEKKAQAAFERAMELKRASSEEPFAEAIRQLQSGDSERARDLFHETFVAVPRLAGEYIERALTRMRTEAWEEALTVLDRALQLNPKYPDLHNYRGITLCEMDRLDEAIAAFRQATELAGEFVVPRLNLAFTLLRAGEYAEAEAELESILEQDPTEPAAVAALEQIRTQHRPEKRRPVARGSVR